MSYDEYLDKLYFLIHATGRTIERLLKITDFPNNDYDEKLINKEIELMKARETMLIGLKNEYLMKAYSRNA